MNKPRPQPAAFTRDDVLLVRRPPATAANPLAARIPTLSVATHPRPLAEDTGILMSNKASCPGCDAYTSAVAEAIAEELACPYCGLSAGAIIEVLSARRRKADADLTARYERAVIDLDQSKREVMRLQDVIGRIRYALGPELEQQPEGVTPWAEAERLALLETDNVRMLKYIDGEAEFYRRRNEPVPEHIQRALGVKGSTE